jgi:hypothetical protein
MLAGFAVSVLASLLHAQPMSPVETHGHTGFDDPAAPPGERPPAGAGGQTSLLAPCLDPVR